MAQAMGSKTSAFMTKFGKATNKNIFEYRYKDNYFHTNLPREQEKL